jgi:RNA 3'-terminal phosphate cyclase-like protein
MVTVGVKGSRSRVSCKRTSFSAIMSQPIHFSGHQHLRSRLVLSILSGKHIRIDKIRSEDKNPGLQGVLNLKLKERHFKKTHLADYEISLLRLLEKVTNGTVIEISVTGSITCLCFGEKRSKQIYKSCPCRYCHPA